MSSKADKEKMKLKRAIQAQAMDHVIQGLQTGIWGIVAGYVQHPLIAASIMEGAVAIYFNALVFHHSKDIAAAYARRLIDMLEPFAEGNITVSEEDWFESLTPPLLEQLSNME